MESLVTPTAAFWRGRHVLVTGHTGFKGAWLCLWLDRLGAKVSGLALAPATEPNLFALAGVDRRIASTLGDIRSFRTVADAVAQARPEIVVHMAAQSLVRPSYEDPIGTIETNVLGTVHVLEAVRRVDSVRVVVNVTSDKCYENREWAWPYRETEPMGGYDPYSCSKGCAELVTSAWRRSFFDGYGPTKQPVAVASARAGNVIGGGDWAQDRLVPDCVRALAQGRPLRLRNPDAIRPWQHVLEPLAGYLILGERLWNDHAEVAEAWNFGPADDDARPVSWVVSRIASRWGHSASWEIAPGDRPHEATYLRVDASKARSRLGWRPRLALREGLDWTVDWYRRFYAGEAADRVTDDQIARYTEMRTSGDDR